MPTTPRTPGVATRRSATPRRILATGLLASLLSGALVAHGSATATADPSSATASATAAAAEFRAVNRARRAGLAGRNKTWTASPVDYNDDGRQDVWVGYHGRLGKLWRNKGNGNYRRVARRAWPGENEQGKTIDRHDCAWADVDRNGLPDAYCSTGRFRLNVVKHRRDNELWLQTRRGRFKEVGTAWGVGDKCGRGRHVTFIHANGDRWPDLFLGNETPRRDRRDRCNRQRKQLPNERSKVFINKRGHGFRYAPRYFQYGAGPGTRCAEVVDFNGDGWDDLLTCRSFNRSPRLYVNRAGRRFVNATPKHRLRSRITDAEVVDLDRDGDPDLVTAGKRGFAYHLNTNRRFTRRVWIGRLSDGDGRSVAVADPDNDGDPDVYGMVGENQRSNPDDYIWLNDDLAFTPIPVPSARGDADNVTALERGGNRRDQFLVLNGFGRDPGPVQLIRLIRRRR